MGYLQRSLATIIMVMLSHGIVTAQSDLAPLSPKKKAAPGWNEFQALSTRLESLESENQWLKNEIDQLHDNATSVNQHHFVDTESETTSNDSWIEQPFSAYQEQLSWNKGAIRIIPFGYAAADMISSEKAYTLLAGPLFLLPAVPDDIPDSRFTISGQQTTLGLDITGPDLETFQSSAKVVFNFFGDRPIQNNPGAFFIQGYLELKNENWRFWAGQDADGIARQNSNSPSWTSHKQSGNAGQIRPGFRAERYFTINDEVQSSLYFGLTQQVVLDFITIPQVAGTDNGWPNVELRWEVGLGSDEGGQKPVMFAVGGLVGQTRAVDFSGRPVANVSSTWAVIPELRIQRGCFGFHGEMFVGQALGTYNAGIGQSLNALTDEAIYTIGGFGEFFYNVNDAVTLSAGYGIDDPRNRDLAVTQRSQNATYWVNAIYRMNEQWETRAEVSRQKTDYSLSSNTSRAMIYQLSVRYYF